MCAMASSDILGSSLQQVGESHVQPAVAHLDVAVHIGERIKLDAKFRQRQRRAGVPDKSDERFREYLPARFL